MASANDGGYKTRPRSLLLLAFQLTAMLSIAASAASAASDEAYGVVTYVLDGDTFDVTIEKADPRITSSVERIRLADVNSPEMNTEGGLVARDFTYAILMNKRVFLDIDDLSENGRDPYGRLVCVAYLTGVYGGPLRTPSFNRMLVDSGYAEIEDFTNNEFSLDEARPNGGRGTQGAVPEAVPESISESVSEAIPDYNLSNQLEDMKNDLLDQLRDALANQLDRWANETVDWLRD